MLTIHSAFQQTRKYGTITQIWLSYNQYIPREFESIISLGTEQLHFNTQIYLRQKNSKKKKRIVGIIFV